MAISEMVSSAFVDELLNFSSDVGEEGDDDDDKTRRALLPSRPPNSSSSSLPKLGRFDDGYGSSFPEAAEEDLEWLSNKDAFPGIETIFPGGIPSGNNFFKQRSPVSVLEMSNAGAKASNLSCWASFPVPGKARSKRCRSRRLSVAPVDQWCSYEKKSIKVERPTHYKTTNSFTGRKCLHCQTEKTPQWRAGPCGPKTLCNACGVRFKSGRLVPEYRPANSPTYSSKMHSNSHRKIMEMRRLKQTEWSEEGVMPVDIG